MKKSIIIFLLFISSFLFAQTHIPSGEVSGRWTINESPYIVDGYITVPVDSTLTIDAGVNVVFSTNNGIQIEGKLLAEGTENDSIIFTVQDTIIDTGIGFYDLNVTSQDSSKITYSVFENVAISFNESSDILLKKSRVSHSDYGAVHFNDNSSPLLMDVIISYNSSNYYGGGISCVNSSSPTLINVTVIGNSAEWGGGISCRNNSNPTIENVSILNNYAETGSSGFYCKESSPILNNANISGNNGIGFFVNHNESSPILNNVIISENYSAAIFCDQSNLTLTHSIIKNNDGGGIYCVEGDGNNTILLQDVIITENNVLNNMCSDTGGGLVSHGYYLTMVNCIVSKNYAREIGGIHCAFSHMNLCNVIITENTIDEDSYVGGIICELESDIIIRNSIIWNNDGAELFIVGGDNSYNLSYSDIGEWNWEGTGMINANPLFTDEDYHLCEGSLCIDSGDPDSLYYDIEDPNNPTYALYPAMGTIRNDIGYYGGHGSYNPYASESNDGLQIMNCELNNYPNPFNPTTTISYQIKKSGKVELNIYNIKGQKVRTLVNDTVNSGNHSVIWNGVDESGKSVSSGVYFYKLGVNGKSKSVKKCLLLK